MAINYNTLLGNIDTTNSSSADIFENIKNLKSAPGPKSDFGRSLSAGWETSKQLGNLAGAAASDLVGWESGRDSFLKDAAANEEAAAEYNKGLLTKIEDIKSIGDVGDYAVNTLGSLAPNIAQTVASGAIGAIAGSAIGPEGTVGGAIGGLLGRKALFEGLKKAAESGVEKQVAKQAAKNLLSKTGAVAGVAASGYEQGVGDVYGETVEAGQPNAALAAGLGLPYAALDAAVPTRLIGKLTSGVGKGRLTGALKEMGISGVSEGATELGQEELLLRAHSALDPKFDINGEEANSRRINAAAAGALGGVALGGASHLVAPSKKEEDTKAKPAINPVSQKEFQNKDIGQAYQRIQDLQTWKANAEAKKKPITGIDNKINELKDYLKGFTVAEKDANGNEKPVDILKKQEAEDVLNSLAPQEEQIFKFDKAEGKKYINQKLQDIKGADKEIDKLSSKIFDKKGNERTDIPEALRDDVKKRIATHNYENTQRIQDIKKIIPNFQPTDLEDEFFNKGLGDLVFESDFTPQTELYNQGVLYETPQPREVPDQQMDMFRNFQTQQGLNTSSPAIIPSFDSTDFTASPPTVDEISPTEITLRDISKKRENFSNAIPAEDVGEITSLPFGSTDFYGVQELEDRTSLPKMEVQEGLPKDIEDVTAKNVNPIRETILNKKDVDRVASLTVQPEDITTKSGIPFKSERVAKGYITSKKLTDSHEVAQVGEEQYVVRPKGLKPTAPFQNAGKQATQPAIDSQPEVTTEQPEVINTVEPEQTKREYPRFPLKEVKAVGKNYVIKRFDDYIDDGLRRFTIPKETIDASTEDYQAKRPEYGSRVLKAYQDGYLTADQYGRAAKIAKSGDLSVLNKLFDQIEQNPSNPNVAFQKTGSKKVGLTIEIDRLLALEGTNLYSAGLVETTVKELVQNSYDAVKGALKLSQVKQGEITIELNRGERTITISDNGVGMNMETMEKAFLRLYGTEKEGLSVEERSGGKGKAKIAILLGNDHVHAETVKAGRRIVLDATPRQLIDGTADIRTESAKGEPNGTKVTIKVPESIKVDGEERSIWFPNSSEIKDISIFSKPLLEDQITFKLKEDRWGTENEEVIPTFDYDANPFFTKINFDWGYADVYISDKPDSYPSVSILSSGVWQFDMYGNKELKDALPHNVTIDVHSRVKPEERTYPFNHSRENWNYIISEDVDSLMGYLINIGKVQKAEETVNIFKSFKQLPTVEVDTGTDIYIAPESVKSFSETIKEEMPSDKPAIVKKSVEQSKTERDSSVGIDIESIKKSMKEKEEEKGIKSSFEAEKELKSAKDFLMDMGVDDTNPVYHNNTNIDWISVNPGAATMFAELGSVMKELRDFLKANSSILSFWGTTNSFTSDPTYVGISIDKQYKGVNIKIPYSGVFLNPLANDRTNIPGIVEDWYQTIVHEFIHENVRAHDESFIIVLHDAFGKISETGKDVEIRNKLRIIAFKNRELLDELRKTYRLFSTENVSRSLKEGERNETVARGLGREGSTDSSSRNPNPTVEGRQSTRSGGYGESLRDGTTVVKGADGDALLSIGDGRVKATPSLLKIFRNVIASLVSKISHTGVTLKYVDSFADLPVEYQNNLKEFGNVGVKGFFHVNSQTIYMVGDQYASEQELLGDVLHELVGHYGLRRVLGKDWDNFVERMLKNPKLVQDVMRVTEERWGEAYRTRFGNDYMKYLFDEYVAELAKDSQKAAHPGLWSRIVGYIKHILRKLGFGKYVEVTPKEEINSLLGQAYREIFENAPPIRSIDQAVPAFPMDKNNALLLAIQNSSNPQIVTTTFKLLQDPNYRVAPNWWQKKANSVLDMLKETPAGKASYLKLKKSPLNHLGALPHKEAYKTVWQEALGFITKLNENSRAIYQNITKLNGAQELAINKYMTSRDISWQTLIPVIGQEKAELLRDSKALISQLGAKFVDLGLLSDVTYQENVDQYLRVRYLQYLNEGKGSGKVGSYMHYLKPKNKSLPQEIKDRLGEITDPRFRIMDTVATMGRDIALLDALKAVYETSKTEGLPWVIGDMDFAEVDGKKYSMVQLRDDIQTVKAMVGRLNSIPGADPQELARMEAELAKLEQAYANGLAKVDAEFAKFLKDPNVPENFTIGDYKKMFYQQLPDTRRYGKLAGLYVRKEIYMDIKETVDAFSTGNDSLIDRFIRRGGYLDRITQVWKTAKVPLNPPAIAHNFLGNFALLDIGSNTNSVKLMTMFGDEFMSAIRSFRGVKGHIDSKYFTWAKEKGLFGTTLSANELYAYEEILKKDLEFKAIKNPTYIDYMAKWMKFGYAIAQEKSGELFGFIEGVFKTTAMRDYIETWEKQSGQKVEALSEQERDTVLHNAASHANEILFDYSAIPYWLKVIRRYPLGAPFLTFMYKMVPQVISSSVQRPQKFIKYIALPYLMMSALAAAYDLDDDDIKEIKAKMPLWTRDHASVYILPWKDTNGNWVAANFGQFLPWAPITDTIMRFYNHTDSSGVAGFTTSQLDNLAWLMQDEMGFLSGPIPSIIGALKSNEDPFTHKEIMKEGDLPSNQLLGMLNYVWSLSMPTMLSEYGLAGRIYNQVNAPLDTFGKDREDIYETLARGVGLSTYPMNLRDTDIKNRRAFDSKINKVQKAKEEAMRNRNLNIPEERAEVMRKFNERIKLIRDQKAAYTRGEY